ncbi:MAG: RagB/SusD family nutrient uptake outer membrane protein [Marinifilaceae bacterium]|jgi:hypothetical protein|nr:RagB/SusD family nutrient uptake outer membrane protein [Marinifilaceae bacterium]
MKKYIFYLFSLGFIFSSCEDMLDIEPENSITHYNYYKSEQDIMGLVYDMQNKIKDAYFAHDDVQKRGVIHDHPINFEGKQIIVKDLAMGAQTEGYSFESHWEWYYQVIGVANLILENIERVGMEKERENFYKGIALFSRSYAYFNQIKIFGDCIYITSVDDLSQKAAMPWREILKLSIKDMEEAASYLDHWNNQTDANGKHLITRQIPGVGAVYAYLAHMNAWMATFGGEEQGYLENAIKYASLTIDGDERGAEFALENNYEDVCNNTMIAKGSEVIYEIDCYPYDGNYLFDKMKLTIMDDYAVYPINPVSGPADNENLPHGVVADVVKTLYNYIERDGAGNYNSSNDKRLTSYFYKFDDPNYTTELNLVNLYKRRKPYYSLDYNNQQQFYRADGNYPAMRLSEIILLRAELYQISGQDSKAIQDLNTIRNRAGLPNYNAGSSILKDEIFHERERELFAEGHRYWDILRSGRYELLKGDVVNFTNQDIEDGALFYPKNIHATENNQKLKQMPFWSKYF